MSAPWRSTENARMGVWWKGWGVHVLIMTVMEEWWSNETWELDDSKADSWVRFRAQDSKSHVIV